MKKICAALILAFGLTANLLAVSHKDLTGADIHVSGYIQPSDPGAVGAGKSWFDTTTVSSPILKIRNAANTAWNTVAGGGGGGSVSFAAIGSLAYYAAAGTVVSGTAAATISSGDMSLGNSGLGFLGTLNLGGSSSGVISIKPQSASGTFNFNLPITAGSSGNVLLSGGGAAAPMTWGTRSGNTTVFATTSGSLPSGNCAKFDASGNLVDHGGACGGGGSPLTTKGDLFGFSTVNVRIPVGTNGQILSSDSAQTNGVNWIAAPGGGNVSASGSPTVGQLGQWVNGTTIKGVGPDASAANGYVKFTSGVPGYGTIPSGDLPTHTHIGTDVNNGSGSQFVPLSAGGVNANLSATGCSGCFLRQDSVGAAITVAVPSGGGGGNAHETLNTETTRLSNTTTAQLFEVYKTTDSSTTPTNYERFQVFFDASAGGSLHFGRKNGGSGTSGNTYVETDGTGVYFRPQMENGGVLVARAYSDSAGTVRLFSSGGLDEVAALGYSGEKWLQVATIFTVTKVGASITAAATIAPTSGIHPLTGTAATVTTITVPTLSIGSFTGSITFLPSSATVFSNAGNIQNTSFTATVNTPIVATYDGSKWWLK